MTELNPYCSGKVTVPWCQRDPEFGLPDRIVSAYDTIMVKHENRTNAIARQRESLCLTQSMLAQRCGTSRSEISAIETGRIVPNARLAIVIARVLGSTVEELFGGEPVAGSSTVESAWGAPSGHRWYARVGEGKMSYPLERTEGGPFAPDIDPATESERTLVVASCDPAAGILVRQLARRGIRTLVFGRSSREAIRLLSQRRIHVAGIHLGGDIQENAKVANELGGPGKLALIRAGTWTSGIAFRPELRKISCSSRALRRRRWVLREHGSAARESTDRLLGHERHQPAPSGPVVLSHRAVAERIRAGEAEVGYCQQLPAEEAQLGFMPIRRESYDLCMHAEHLKDWRIQSLLQVMRSPEYHQAISSIPGMEWAAPEVKFPDFATEND
jgi:putative molybdopterin biosynthesis protein